MGRGGGGLMVPANDMLSMVYSRRVLGGKDWSGGEGVVREKGG